MIEIIYLVERVDINTKEGVEITSSVMLATHEMKTAQNYLDSIKERAGEEGYIFHDFKIIPIEMDIPICTQL
jgi:hypothetical protein